jgi:glycosyltransferase involved in cell wall biosynthesis
LVLENNSSDRTTAHVMEIADEDPRVRLVRTGAKGLPEALNIGIELAKTDLVARMDADDITLPGRFAAQRRAFAEQSDLVMCGTQIKRFVSDPDKSKSVSNHPLDHDDIVDGLIRGRHVVTHASVMFSRAAAVAVSGYWSHGLSEDCDFFLRLSRHGRIGNLELVGYAVRFHGESVNARRQMEVLLGMRFAAYSYCAEGEGDVDYASFRDSVMSHPWRRRKLRVDATSDNLYRSSQIRLLESRFSGLGYLQLAGAAVLRIDKTLARVRQHLTRRFDVL